MRQKSGTGKAPAEQVIKDIRRVTRKQYGAEEKIRIVLDFLPGDLERQVRAFVDHCNHRRYHESLGNLTPRRRLLRTRRYHQTTPLASSRIGRIK